MTKRGKGMREYPTLHSFMIKKLYTHMIIYVIVCLVSYMLLVHFHNGEM